jgi:hypothetical protein
VLRVQSNHSALLLEQQEKLASEQELAMRQSKEERTAAEEAARLAQAEVDRMAKQRQMEEERLMSAKYNKDALDVEVRKMMHKMTTTVQLIRLRSGTYLIKGTTKKIFVRILNTMIMVRVGGGWEKLEKWLERNKPKLSESSKSDAKKRSVRFLRCFWVPRLFWRSPDGGIALDRTSSLHLEGGMWSVQHQHLSVVLLPWNPLR